MYAQDLNLPASWVLVDYLTWTPKAGGAIPVNAQTEPNYCTSGASQESSRACCAAIDVHQTHSADSTAAAKQGATRAGRRASKARARLQAQDVHIVRPSGLHRTASCPEEAARDLAGQPRGGRRAAAALRSHSLGSEAREDLGSQQRSLPPAGASGSLRSHSLELPSDDGVPCLASHAVDVDGSEAGSTRGSFADLTSLAEAETGSTDGLDSGDSMASAASSLSLPDDLAFQDALAPQVKNEPKMSTWPDLLHLSETFKAFYLWCSRSARCSTGRTSAALLRELDQMLTRSLVVRLVRGVMP